MPAFASCILPELCLHLHGARRILEEWILLEDRSPVLLDEVHSSVQAKAGVQSVGDRLVEYDRCCISREESSAIRPECIARGSGCEAVDPSIPWNNASLVLAFIV